AEVRNIGIVDVNIISIGSDVGGLVGFNQGKVTNCYSRGKVNGYYGVGGFVGENLGTVTDCYNNSSVTGISDIGGLVGVNMGKVINSYSTGVVDGDDFIGGLIGSYSLGSVINSVWDMDTSGLSESNGGIGLTTNEMRDPYMLGLNGFANDPNWILDAGNDYPRLAWEGSAGEIIPKPSINWLEGSGIAEDPYLIDKAEQLILLGKASILCNAHFKLCTDINLDPKLLEIDIFEKALIPFFNGIFDGNGYTVSNIVIDGGYYLGLFSRLENSAEVRNLGIEDANVVSYEGHSGALAGLNLGIINNCNVTSTVSGSGSSDYIGGLVGSNYGIITNSNSTCVVSGNWYIGGLVGNNEGNVTNCYSTGIVSGNWYIGGLIGSNMFDNEVINCYSTGTVSGDHYNVGGLVGGNLGKVFRCYSTSTASGGETGDSIGGLIGSNMFGGEVSNCYSSGTVNGEYSIGGLVGENIEGRVSNCYSIGRVNGEDEVGGLIGLSSSANSTGCFWDTWTSGLSVSDGGLRRTTDEMKDINTYQVEGWDFFLEASDNDPNWIMSYNDYPHLAWEYPIWAEIPDLNGISFEEAVDIITGAGFLLADISPIYSETIIDNYVINQIPEIGSIGFIGFTKFNLSILCPDKFTAGSGSESDPYQISTLFDWLLLSNYPEYWAENFILINDINLMNLTITPIGSETVPFIGSFNGNGYSICNAVINRKDEDFVGLFGYLMNGQITGLRFKDSRVYGNDIVGGLVGFADSNSNFSSCSIEVTVSGNSIVGGLGGSNWGKVVQCYCNGTINGYSHVGGLVGYNNNTINDCNSNAIVTGNDYIGGLAGWNNGDIIKCYSTVDVNGFLEVGGLVGHNNGILNICYSSGKVNGEYGVGGLVGHNNGTLNICYSTGKVNGEYGVGGLVGVNYYDDFMQNKESGSIIKCYSNVNVYGLYSAGGLIGEHYGALVDNCYSSGTVNGNGYIGGLLGFYEDIGLLFEDLLNNSLWDIESSGVLNGIGNMNTDPIGVLGKTTAEMQTQITFTDAGWDFIGETINGPNDIWWILEGKDYPRLWWQLPVDDFNNCNAAPLWITDEMTPELVCLEETNSRLEVNSVGPLEYAEALYVSDGWWIDANESFALKVDFHFSQSGEGDGRISLGIRPGYADDMTQYAQLEAGSIDNDIYYLYTVTDEEFIDVNDWDRFLDDGVLYISYDPNFDELYFSNIGYGVDNAVYTVTGLVKDLWQCDSLSFYLGGGSQNMILTGEDAWLDNFAIDEGKIFQ
ncbi:MAG: PASTA domain-containing protein, partial [Bacteroidales bacterium]|nr:PASTA domain-containing protein [Bacteroidales bacterium]